MLIAVPKETKVGESRTPLTPECVKKLTRMGAEISVESSVGMHIGYTDEDYRQAGAKIVSDKIELLEFADVVLRVQKPLLSDEISCFRMVGHE